ncbi:MAG: M3 family metallopeptidase [Methanobrevibacter sp.]|uniref:M3 family metallopeptidase n=1 Tax=Methanobrevibacter sp. TaxID=66852 RepID=UPI003F093C8F
MGILDTPPRWNLNNLQSGGNIKMFENHLCRIKEELQEIQNCSVPNQLKEIELIRISALIKQIESAESFYYCLTTENIEHSLITSLNGTISTLKSQVHMLISDLQEELSKMSKDNLNGWVSRINHKKIIMDLLKEEVNNSSEEKLVSNFSRETLSGLEDIYIQLRNNIKVIVNSDKKSKEIPFVEAIDLAMSHPIHNNRILLFKELNQALKSQANVFASIYNQIVGLRLNENALKKVDYLDKSLNLNGISKQIINTMWDVVDTNLPTLSKYIKIKAREVGKERLSWHELMTSSLQEVPFRIEFSQAVDGITKSLGSIDRNIPQFIKTAISKGWVDAEQRSSKQPGGFCAPFFLEGESRISLSYDNSLDSARILAHELGHAWHFHQMKDIPSLSFSDESLEMTMAETSSIFFETAFIDYLIENTMDISIKKAILQSKIERCLNYLMNIRGAFLFENSFYKYRKNGQLDVEQIEELSLKCQEIAYGNSLSEYEPFVWIKYIQFYEANTPFYNYPYSFGFLLSIGLLEIAKEDNQFDQKFRKFLNETGILPLELLIKKHFNIDLSEPEFWEKSIKRLITDIEYYSQYCE